MTGRRSLALIVLGVVLALAGLACAYVRRELAEPEAFADRAVEALRSDQVREVIAEQITVALLERGSPDLVSSRPLLLTAVEAVLETDEFARVLRRSAVTAHAVLGRMASPRGREARGADAAAGHADPRLVRRGQNLSAQATMLRCAVSAADESRPPNSAVQPHPPLTRM